MRVMHPSRRTRRARRDREGVVLLITALVLMIVSATAVYAVQQGAFEVRAAGAARQALRTKYVSESFVMAGLSCIEDTLCSKSYAAGDVWRTKYGVPEPNNATPVPEVRVEVRPENFPKHFSAEIAPSDAALSAGDFVTAYTPSDTLVWEDWPIEEVPQGNQQKKTTHRFVATCYGELALTNDAVASGETRGIHETISISRAYYTKR